MNLVFTRSRIPIALCTTPAHMALMASITVSSANPVSRAVRRHITRFDE